MALNLKDESIYYLKRMLTDSKLKSLRAKNAFHEFDKHRCIFIHIPKTAGISVARSLLQTRIGHLSALDFQAVMGKEDFKRYFKFAFVRNPFTRLVSAYEFMQAGGYGPVDQPIVEVVRRYKTLEEFVLGYLTPGAAKAIRHFRPQHYFICNSNQELMVDYLGRFEHLDQDYEYIRQKIGAGEPLKKLNTTKTKKNSLQEYFANQQVIDKVSTIYQKDFQLFNYPVELPL